MRARLVALSSAYAGEVRGLGDRTNIGRGEMNEIQLLDEAVSRQHACIAIADEGNLVIHDMQSRNGTSVNGDPISHRSLEPGDEIQIGSTRFRFEVNDEPISRRASEAADDDEGWGRSIQAAATRPPVHCASPLHEDAEAKRWPYCPACGGGIVVD